MRRPPLVRTGRPGLGGGAALLVALGLALVGAPVAAQPVDPDLLSELEPRSIGPAGMGGRIAAIDGVAADPDALWVGAATGGVWATDNGGDTWRAVFDDQPLQGVGAVAVFQPNPDVVWVGTGEANPRNSAGVGAGVYRTRDGGRSWRLLGLEESERISRIVLHPTDPDVAWVAALGPAWSDGGQRGVYRTTDGGDTWQRVLGAGARVGASDLVMDPESPGTLVAGLWEYRRWPWFFESGGEGSGLWITRDGGDSWSRLGPERGVPAGPLGRIGLAWAPSDPEVLYALVEAERSALLRSDDGGRRWRTVNASSEVNPRPFYYTDLRVDPENPERVWNLHSRLQVSEDGGRTFETVRADLHPDLQAFWIDPSDGGHLVLGSDGGVYASRDRGESWRLLDNLPVGQFYHVGVDMAIPFHVYGGMQDNGSWRGPSDAWSRGGIRNHDWRELAFGDGFGTRIDPTDPDLGYAMSQEGGLRRFDLRTGERKDIRPWAPRDVELRFNWDAPLAIDPFDPGTIYYGSQFVHRSSDRGDTWQIISQDLTTDDPEKQRQGESGGLTADDTGAENHTTLTTIAPSPVQEEVIWAGSDDGRLHLTTSGGGNWTDVTDNVPDVPAATWVSHVEASKHHGGTAYVAFDDHRRGDWTPYLLRTDDYGRSWESLSRDAGLRGFVHTVEQDPLAPELLFAGTEFGLYVSMDGGTRWFQWTYGFPSVPVRSLVVHPRDYDLVVGTHGRAAWILDDIRPLRALARTPELARRPLHLFEPPPAFVHVTAAADGHHFGGSQLFRGEDRPYGALLSWWGGLGDPGGAAADPDSVTVEVENDAGRIVRSFRRPSRPGINRTVWDLRTELRGRDPEADGAEPGGPEALPGTYTVRIVDGEGRVSDATLDLLPDPRVRIAPRERRAKHAALENALELDRTWRRLLREARDVRRALNRVLRLVGDGEDALSRALLEEADSVRAGADDLEGQILDAREHRRTVRSLSTSYDAPTEAQRIALARMEDAVSLLVLRMNDFLAGPVADFRRSVDRAGVEVLPELRLPPP